MLVSQCLKEASDFERLGDSGSGERRGTGEGDGVERGVQVSDHDNKHDDTSALGELDGRETGELKWWRGKGTTED